MIGEGPRFRASVNCVWRGYEKGRPLGRPECFEWVGFDTHCQIGSGVFQDVPYPIRRVSLAGASRSLSRPIRDATQTFAGRA